MSETDTIVLDWVEEYRGVTIKHGHSETSKVPVAFTEASPYLFMVGPHSVKKAHDAVDFDLANPPTKP